MFKRLLAMLLLLLTLFSLTPVLGDEDLTPYFEEALSQLQTPAQEGLATGTYFLRTGENAYVPDVAPEITPADSKTEPEYPPINGTFESSDVAVVTVSEEGLMTAWSEGTCQVTYHTAEGDQVYTVTVGDDLMPEGVKNYLYVINREFNTVQRVRMKKDNQYTRWYYKKKNGVEWCSVFVIYCANASGNAVPKRKNVTEETETAAQFFAEGYPSNQYEGYKKLGRFTGVPKPGYLVIYADMKKAYRTTHIASVAEVTDMGDGVYMLRTIEGNMFNSVTSYCYLYDSKIDNHEVGDVKGLKLQKNMSTVPEEYQTDPRIVYDLNSDHWSVYGFCATWE